MSRVYVIFYACDRRNLVLSRRKQRTEMVENGRRRRAREAGLGCCAWWERLDLAVAVVRNPTTLRAASFLLEDDRGGKVLLGALLVILVS
jgi:hypothetical protein